jgi:hypothetical protein
MVMMASVGHGLVNNAPASKPMAANAGKRHDGRRRSDPQAPPAHANRHKMQVLHTAIFAQYWSNRKTKTAHSGRHIASHANDNGRVTAVRALDSHLSTPTRYETGQKGRPMGSKHK